MKTIFAGTPAFAALHLEALLNAGHVPVAVYTQPDRPAGRGRKPRAGEVKALAQARGLEVRQPVTLRDDAVQAEMAALEADLMVVVAYGLILPKEVLSIPSLGCINVHASLLPRWRGAAPIQRAILSGDDESGASLMLMDEGLDTGPVLRTVRCPIGPTDTGGVLHDRLADLGSCALVDTLADLEREPIEALPQPEEGVSYAHKLEKVEAKLVWEWPAQRLDRLVRAFNPWPVAYSILHGERMRIWCAEPLSNTYSKPAGTVVDVVPDGIIVSTGEGGLKIAELQLPGGRKISAADYLNSHPSPVGEVFT